MELPSDFFPPGLPSILEYCCGPVVLYALPRTPVEFVSSSGKTTAALVKPTIPTGATGWRLSRQTEWRPLSELPTSWLPFLNRRRGTVMDPRPAPKGQQFQHDAIVDGGDK